jgi:mannose-1-phosphate guanylyltransferase
VGSRFWPVSTPERPKQLLALGSERPLVADTVERILPLVPPGRLRILTGRALAAPILAALPLLDETSLLLEPRARGTAPVLVWAAHAIERAQPGAVLTSLHADHVIAPAGTFRDLLGRLAALASREERLYTIGIEPTRPETGYGYIRVGAPLEPPTHEVGAFVEKPDATTAAEYLRAGGHLWNSGIFVWRAAVMLEQVRRHTPELAELLPLLDRGDVDGFFERAPVLSIDEGLLERSDRVAVARATFAWDDVGTWDAVGRTRATDEHGNVGVGDVHLVDAGGCIAWAEDGPVVLFGTQDLVVVRSHGIAFVAPRARTAELKELLRQLPAELRSPEG